MSQKSSLAGVMNSGSIGGVTSVKVVWAIAAEDRPTARSAAARVEGEAVRLGMRIPFLG